MDKIKITLPTEEEYIEVEFCGANISIKQNISLEEQAIIIRDIKENILYNDEIEDKFVYINARIIRDLLEMATNIDVEEISLNDCNLQIFEDLFYENCKSYWHILDCVDFEYRKWIIENGFGLVAAKTPSGEEMNASIDKLSQALKDLPEDKLELIAKSIVWNNAPALGATVAPVEHVKQGD